MYNPARKDWIHRLQFSKWFPEKKKMTLHYFLELISDNYFARIRLWFGELHGTIIWDLCSCKSHFSYKKECFEYILQEQRLECNCLRILYKSHELCRDKVLTHVLEFRGGDIHPELQKIILRDWLRNCSGKAEGSRNPWVIQFHGRLGCRFVTLCLRDHSFLAGRSCFISP